MIRRSVLSWVTALVVFPAIAAAATSSIAHIHGKIISIDRRRGTFFIHHDPFALMPMSMTMEVEPLRKSEFTALHVGEMVNATIDTKIVPWPASAVTRAKP